MSRSEYSIDRREVVIDPDGTLLESGETRPRTLVDVEIYGSSPENPPILLIPPLTCPAAAVGTRVEGRGWWDHQIGPGRSLDTDQVTIVSIRPRLGEATDDAGELPRWSIRDIVHLIHAGRRTIGLDHVAAVVGPSFGGMVALESALLYPGFADRLLLLGVGSETNARRLGLNLVALRILELGEEVVPQNERLALARSLALLSYRGDDELDVRFGRGRDGEGWLVGWYLARGGEKFAHRMSAGEYRLLIEALNSYDLGRNRGGARDALRTIDVPTLCIGISSDRLYPVGEVRSLAGRIPRGEYREIESAYGHDAFLIEAEPLRAIIAPFLGRDADTEFTEQKIETKESEICAN